MLLRTTPCIAVSVTTTRRGSRRTPEPTRTRTRTLHPPTTGDLTFEGMTYEAAQDNTDVFVAAVADLCGVAASAVTVEISEARRRRLAEGIVVTYTVGVATANEADAVTSAISSSSTAGVDAINQQSRDGRGRRGRFRRRHDDQRGYAHHHGVRRRRVRRQRRHGGADAERRRGLIAGVVVGVAALAAIGVGAFVYMRSKASGADLPLAEVQLVGSADESPCDNTSDSSGSPSTMGGKEVEMSDADFGNIERKVLLEDRPWMRRRLRELIGRASKLGVCRRHGRAQVRHELGQRDRGRERQVPGRRQEVLRQGPDAP